MKLVIAIALTTILSFSCQNIKTTTTTPLNHIDIEKISDNAFVHISYLIIPRFGKFGCNGLIYVNDGEAIIFDTPVDKVAAKELYRWIEQELDAKVIVVVVNHFHVDCLGSLDFFHRKGVPSYANQLTKVLAQADSVTIPTHTFVQKTEISVGKTNVECRFLGEGHTKDNIVSWIPDEKLLFGGCMVKALKAGKGNLRDANIDEWSNTVEKIKKQYPNIKVVVPGHGLYGGVELLDYTIEMFKK